jgi:hypothetical protein
MSEGELPEVNAMIAAPVITRRCTDSHAAVSGTRRDRNFDTFGTA